jgi:sarcosine oxidase
MRNFEAIVIGSGGMGSSTTYHLAKRGMKTLTLERFSLNHTNGSSHGKSRVIRTVYAEDPFYVPLIKKSFNLWHELEKEWGNDKLLQMTGFLMTGTPEGPMITGAFRSAREHNLSNEKMDASEIKQRFQIFNILDDEIGVYDPNAGILFPEKCIEAFTSLAKRSGAEFHFNEQLLKWEVKDDKVIAKTGEGEYSADKIIFAAGPWLTQLLPDLKLPLQCERQVVFWFRSLQKPELFKAGRMPIFAWEDKTDRLGYYSLPDTGEGVKVGKHHGGEKIISPDQVNREITKEDQSPVRTFLRERIPWIDGSPISATTCLYTNSPDNHFLIDFHPRYRNMILVSACSGHGFKFASVIGEIVSDLALKGKTSQDISLFGLQRIRSKHVVYS